MRSNILKKACATIVVIIVFISAQTFAQQFIKNFSAATSFVKVGNTVFFAAQDANYGLELWKTNGTLEGTSLVKDIKPGPLSSNIANLTVFKGKIYFSANDGINGAELWTSDGTAAGTSMIKDINPARNISGSSSPSQFTVCNDILYFTAAKLGNYRGLWKTDGTNAGTVQLAEDDYFGYSQFTPIGQTIYFTASGNRSLWKTNGSIAGTKKVTTDDNYTVDLLKNINGELVYITNTSYRQNIRLYKLNPTDDSFKLLKSFNAVTYGNNDIDNITQVGSGFYFSIRTVDANDKAIDALWFSNGTPETTRFVKGFEWYSHSSNSYMQNFISLNNKLYFGVTTQFQIYTSDGTENGTVKVSDAKFAPEKQQLVSNQKIFFNNDGLLWSFDGITAKQEFSTPRNPTQLFDSDGTIFFTIADQSSAALWNSRPEASIQISSGYQQLEKNATISFSTKTDSVANSIVTIKNLGNKELILSEISVTGNSFYVNGTPAESILPGKQTTFNLLYLPIKDEQSSGLLNIKSSDDSKGFFNVNLTGATNGTAINKYNPGNISKQIAFKDSIGGFSLSNNRLAEGMPVNSVIGNFSSLKTSENYTYSFVQGAGDADNNDFKIDGQELKSNKIFDFENKSSYTVRVRANNTNTTIEKSITILINNLQKNIVSGNCIAGIEYLNYTLDDVAYTNTNIIAVGDQGKILASKNDGQDWSIIPSGISEPLISIKMTDDQIGYIIGYYGSMLKTETGGDSWFPVKVPDLTYPYVNNMHFVSSLVGYIFGEGKLYKTTDGAKNWKKLIVQNFGNPPSGAYFVDENNGFICGSSQLLRTKDGGLSWENIVISNLGFAVNLSKITFVNKDLGFIVTSSGDILQSKDGGSTWSKISNAGVSNPTRLVFTDEKTGFILSGWNELLQKTTDGGLTWIKDFSSSSSYLGFAYNKSKNKYCMVGHGVNLGYTSSQGRAIALKNGSEAWAVRSLLGNDDHYRLELINEKTAYVLGSGAYKTLDGGITWSKLQIISDSYGKISSSAFLNESKGFYANTIGLYKTTDGGTSWSKANFPNYTTAGNLTFINDKVGFISTYNTIYKTIDGGETWEKNLQSDENLSWRSINFINDQTGFAFGFGNKFYKTVNQGLTWENITISDNPFISSLYFFNSETGLIGCNGGLLFKTVDGGKTFTEIRTQLSMNLTGFAFFDNQHGYAIGNNGGGISEIYETSDGAVTWTFITQISENISQIKISNGKAYIIGGRGNILLLNGGNPKPVNTGYINGESTVAAGIKYTYSTPAVNKVNYNWTTNAPATIEYQNNVANITWKQAGKYLLTATALNNCAAGESRTLEIEVKDFQTPKIIGLDSVLSQSANISYSTKLNQDHSYNWSITGGTLTVNKNTANASWGDAGTGVITVVETDLDLNMKKAASLDVVITKAPTIPANNFEITINGVSCKGSTNGIIKIKTVKTDKYLVLLTGSDQKTYNFTFSDSLKIEDLKSGNYSLCISIEGNTNFSRCYNLNITEPKDLSVYSTVNKDNQSLTLSLSGGELYYIDINGKKYQTSGQQFDIKLEKGINDLKITTDKTCQGLYQKRIIIDGINIFPNPVKDILNIDLGGENSPEVKVELNNLAGQLIMSKTFMNNENLLVMEMNTVPTGIYLMRVTTKKSKAIFKIIKQ